jgi:hypothetical protein
MKEFDTLLETVAGLAAANIVIVETLHEHGIIDKTHFAHAFGRALDTLAPEHRGGMIEQVLQNLRDRCMNLPPRGPSDAREWLNRLLAHPGTHPGNRVP